MHSPSQLLFCIVCLGVSIRCRIVRSIIGADELPMHCLPLRASLHTVVRSARVNPQEEKEAVTMVVRSSLPYYLVLVLSLQGNRLHLTIHSGSTTTALTAANGCYLS